VYYLDWLTNAFSRLQVLAVVGDLYGLGDEVCGIVCGTKATDSIISIWNKTAQDDDAKYKIRYNSLVLIALPARLRVFVLWPRSRTCRRCLFFSGT